MSQEPILKFIRVQLGRVERWPRAFKLALPVLSVMVVWLLVTPLAPAMGIVPAAPSRLRVIEQGAVVGLAAICPQRTCWPGPGLSSPVDTYGLPGRL